MKINRNMSAVMTNNQLLRTESKLSASMERLSSGLKINSPGDNPSGMAISNKMRAQIKALDQDEDNIADGISVMQIADGALNETTSILQRIRELSVQAANGTNSTSDKESIQAEIDELVDEVDRISTDTEYNEKTLLDGSSDTRVYTKVYADDGTGTLTKAIRSDISRINISDDVEVGTYNFTIDATAKAAKTSMPLPSSYSGSTTLLINGQGADIYAGMTDNDYIEAVRTAAEAGGCSIDPEYDSSGNLTGLSIISNHYGSTEEISIEMQETVESGTSSVATVLDDYGDVNGSVTIEGIEVDLSECSSTTDVENAINDALKDAGLSTQVSVDSNGYISPASGGSISVTISHLYQGSDAEITLDLGNTFEQTATYHAEGNHIYITDQGGFSIDFQLDDDAEELDQVEIEVTDVGRMVLQVGANEYQTINVRIPETSSETLYLDTVNVVEYKGAERAMNTLDDAIDYVNSVRSRIGAYQNRLEYANNSTSATNENMTSAYSTLLDTDMAEEMTEYTQQNVLEQASISVLSQANELPQQVLQLLS